MDGRRVGTIVPQTVLPIEYYSIYLLNTVFISSTIRTFSNMLVKKYSPNSLIMNQYANFVLSRVKPVLLTYA